MFDKIYDETYDKMYDDAYDDAADDAANDKIAIEKITEKIIDFDLQLLTILQNFSNSILRMKKNDLKDLIVDVVRHDTVATMQLNDIYDIDRFSKRIDDDVVDDCYHIAKYFRS